MNISEAIRRLEATKRNILSNLEAAEAENVRKIVDLLKQASSGPYTLAQLAKMGHPYAKRFKGSRLPAGIINAQSGRFRANWKGTAGKFAAGHLRSRIVNKSRVAAYLKKGTDKMIARPIYEVVMKQYGPERRRRLQDALRKSLK